MIINDNNSIMYANIQTFNSSRITISDLDCSDLLDLMGEMISIF